MVRLIADEIPFTPRKFLINVDDTLRELLEREDTDAWLAGSTQTAFATLKPYPAERMHAWQVSRRVNTPKNNHPNLIEQEAPVATPWPTDDAGEQGSFDLAQLDPGEPIVE